MAGEASNGKAEGGADRQFVASLEKGLAILTAFRPEDRALSNQELADRTGMPRPTVARFTHTLRKLRYLAYHPRTSRYSLTARVFELSQAGFASTGLRDIMRPAMEALSELGPFSVALGIPVVGGVRYLELVRRPEAIVLNLEVGALLPYLPTAIGRAYLAEMPEAQRQETLARLEAEQDAPSPTLREGVLAEVERFASHGYTASFGAWWPEINAVATTIRVADDGDPLLLSLSGLSSVLTPDRVEEECAAALLSTAQMIRMRLRRLYPD
ncbi:IclR family transcriptional regulator [Shimia sp. FJ5]|uniref:IclR family transcriptional regulator n=1 Tax=Shimia sp. FJ5 TaxID=3079054 RepID=UPI00260BAB20|nr:IclR family transcriptional regulator [Shimia sp. FJ5]MDV4145273.1 IclR family transcriptional regulator [Shimia sp. FJ5]